MTVTLERVEDGVVRVHCRSWRGAAVGYDVSAWIVHGVLVDTGFPRVSEQFLRALHGIHLRGAVVTHHHEDHAGSAAALAAVGLPLHMHPGCEATLRARPSIGLYRRAVWGRAARLTTSLVPFDAAPLQVLPLPGHTADHLVVWEPEREILVSGDLFLGVKVRVAHHDESPGTLVASLRAAAALKPRLLLDAHRGVLHSPARLLHAKADWLEETMAAVRALAATGMSGSAITRRVLGRESFVGWVSAGEYSKRALVRAMMDERGPSNLTGETHRDLSS